MKITIEGGTPQELAANLAEILLRGWRDWDEDKSTSIEERAQRIVEKKLNDHVAEGVQRAVAEFTTEKAREVVEKTLADGIKRTNDYGHVERVQTWQDFVVEQLVRDRYNSDKVQRLARETVEKLFQNQLKGLLDDVVKQVRAQVDDLVGQKIKSAVRSAVGVKE